MQYSDVQTLWNEISGYNWTALRRALESHYNGTYQGINEGVVKRLYQAVIRLESGTDPFPASMSELYTVLYQNY